MLSNFETCPHCVAKGKSGSIWRMYERTPLISRSDGTTFHLILFDGPGATLCSPWQNDEWESSGIVPL